MRAVLAGEILVVFLAETEMPLGESIQFTRTFAGAESNTAIALSRGGVSTTFLGRVGSDAFGRAAIRHLRGEGVDVSHMRADPKAPTAMLARSVSSSTIEVIYGRRGSAGSQFRRVDVPAAAFDKTDLLHFSGITPMLSGHAAEACLLACDLARAAGAAISFDPNLRLRIAALPAWRTRLAPFLRVADVVLTGADEAVALTQATSWRAAAEQLHQVCGALVVVKDGARGASAFDGRNWHSAPAVEVPAVDPVGAGDAFNAGFLGAWLQSRDLRQALTSGTRNGAMSVGTRGDTTGIADTPSGPPSSPGEVCR